MPWILSVGLWWSAPHLARLLTPASTVIAIPVAAVVSALAVAASAAAVGAVLTAQEATWLRVIGWTLVAVLAWRVVQAGRHLGRVGAGVRAAATFTSRRSSSDVVVIEDDRPDAFASPTDGGVVLVTTGLVAALDESHVAAVVAHERAHLKFRHHVWIQAAEVASEIAPFTRRLTGTVRHAAERQADEFAARTDRDIVLQAIARVALLHTEHGKHLRTRRPAGSGGDIVERVRALAEPKPPPQKRSVVVLVVAVVLVLGAAIVGLADVVQDVVAPEIGEAPTSVFR
ncbi:MAG: M56 family metallopeptidase [Rhodococcus sp. (in: high G+C Gram-positive bacteria)]